MLMALTQISLFTNGKKDALISILDIINLMVVHFELARSLIIHLRHSGPF